MPLDLKLAAKASIGRLFSAVFWLQLSACAVVGWTLLHGGVSPAPSAHPATPATGDSEAAVAPESAIPGPIAQDAAGVSGSAIGSGQEVSAGSAAPTSVHPEAAADPSLSTTEVTVTRNDTLDRIFRRGEIRLPLRRVPGRHHAGH